MSHTFDAIVVGLGAIGSATALELARRGVAVLGLEQFVTPHEHGSSHGETRVIRQAYFEDPAYVPLLKRAYELWSTLQSEYGQQLFVRCGLVQIGSADGPVISGVRRSAREHRLPLETLDHQRLSREFPQFVVPEASVALFEANAGYLFVESCVQAQLARARALGAVLTFDCPVTQWDFRAGTFCVKTAAQSFSARRLVFTCGPWASKWVPDGESTLQVLLKHVYWSRQFGERFRQPGCPVFLYELPHGVFYGFPATMSGVKIAEHSGGIPASGHPTELLRQTSPRDRTRVLNFATSYLSWVRPPYSESTCWYTMSPDGHFLVDESPDSPGLYFVAGLSGHGFKFAPVLGEILADFVVHGTTRHPISPFRVARLKSPCRPSPPLPQ